MTIMLFARVLKTSKPNGMLVLEVLKTFKNRKCF